MDNYAAKKLIEGDPELKKELLQELAPKQYKLSEFGNAERLVDRHGKDIRFCHAWNKWLVWDGKRWCIDETGEIERRAKETVRNMYKEAANIEDEEQRAAVAKFAARSETNRAISAMVDLAKSEPGIPVLSDTLDRDIWFLNCLNGTLDLRTGKLKPHDRNDYITRLVQVEYDPAADFPEWARFLNRIMDGNQNLIDFLQRAVGYSLTGSTREQCLFMPYGSGANGKSTFLETIADMLSGYAERCPTDTLMQKNTSGISNDIAMLRGSRLVIASEVEQGRKMAEALVKQMTGQDKISARFMRAEFFKFMPTFKLWIGTNHKPTISGGDNAIWRRIRLIPFSTVIPPEERDKELPDKLRKELPGILNWAVMGCRDWLENGLGEPEEVIRATDNYRAEMDVITRFIDDCCTTSTQRCTKSSELYNRLKDWLKENGEYPLSNKVFSIRMQEKGFRKIERSTGNYWEGIAIEDEGNQFKSTLNGGKVEG